MTAQLWADTYSIASCNAKAGQMRQGSETTHVLSEMWAACNAFRSSGQFYMDPQNPVHTVSYEQLRLTKDKLHSMDRGGGACFFRELVRCYCRHGTQGDFRNTKRQLTRACMHMHRHMHELMCDANTLRFHRVGRSSGQRVRLS